MSINYRKVLLIVITLLFIPLIGMTAFPSEVNWTIFDFTVAFILLFITGLCISFISERFQDTNRKVLYVSIIITVVILIWLELAVGLVESIFSGS
jgi:hypothetical membrane protein